MDELIVTIKTEPDDETSKDCLYTEVMIGDVLLAKYKNEILDIDLLELAISLGRDGEYFFITCGCGEAGCAGIFDSIKVSRDAGRVQWVANNFQGVHGSLKVFQFDAEAYSSAIKQAVKQFVKLYKDNPNVTSAPFMLGERIVSYIKDEWFSRYFDL